ncbi:uncharacterized protein G6M90_00g046770 [Metarhizium brunneum]|uniref:Uncharacterized protein n=1 Tax=Metarhizium brunneum TaxID=500148 RepID=A0A7D5UU52_9HYPO|nr:hypothetical protein G6M90_00g046770 [Metarhizium brunneum]
MLVLEQSKIGAASIVAAGACAHARAHAPSQTENELGPPPTTPPVALTQFSGLFGRQAAPKTCGYVSGVDPLTCASGPYTCLYNTRRSVQGCCTDRYCTLPTACVSYDSPSPTDAETVYCRNSAKPSCLTLSFVDDPCSGCTWFACSTTDGTRPVYNTRPPSTTTTSASTSTTSASAPSTVLPPENPTPVGAIIGGVVGGVAALALVGGSMSFLLRRWRQKPPAPTAQPQPSLAFAPGAEFGSGPAHGYPGSIAKQEAADMTGSNSNTGLYASSPSSPAPASVYSPGYMDQQIVPQPPFRAQQVWYPFPVHEVLTTRAERQVQELPGL